MPYHVGARGSYGCNGYPAVKDDGTVMGCHSTQAEAEAQIYAINQSEGNIDKMYSVRENFPGCDGFAVVDSDGELDGCFATRAEAEAYARAENEGEDEMSEESSDLETDDNGAIVSKQEIKEGDYVMGMTTEGIAHGVVEHIMWEGGTLGTPGSEYAIESMPPQNPAMSVRVFEEEDGRWVPTAYSIGMMYQDAQRLDTLDGHSMPAEMEDEMLELSKAETYTPNAGMRAAARRALRWKEEGKATGAGTPVGWGRATDIVAGRSMSLSVVRRMFSFFSRHEVDKKAPDFNNFSDPSNGRIMWDAWGGDAGYAWSKRIVERNRDKALFANFGKDYTKAERLVEFGKGYDKDEMYKAVRVGSMVSWNSSGGRAEGRVRRILRSGTYNVPGTSVSLNASPDDPVAVITLYRDGKPTDITVGHKLGTLRLKN